MAKYRDPKVSVAPAYRALKRQIRSPQHPFQLRTRPFQIQPFVVAPVLPGETLTNALIQSRVVTDPLVPPGLVGWWTEYFLFFVKLRDLDFHEDPTGATKAYEQMVINPSAGGSGIHDAAKAANYHIYGVDWTQKCLETVTEYYFRDQGENWDAATLDTMPLAQITGKSWLDSLTPASDLRDRDVDMDMNLDGDITVQESLEAQQLWQAMRDAGVEEMDYEDYLRTFGTKMEGQADVSTSPNLFKPELLRYSRNWTYPVNIVDPATGVPSTAASWAIAFRADKARFFKEPGFVFGVTVTRPKTYVKDQDGALVGALDKMQYWLPALLHNNYEMAFRNFDDAEGPVKDLFTGTEASYWVDMRDLFIHGDQLINFDPANAASAVSCLTAAGAKRYPDATTVDALFNGANKLIRQDGVCHLQIKGRQRDRTPTGVAI